MAPPACSRHDPSPALRAAALAACLLVLGTAGADAQGAEPPRISLARALELHNRGRYAESLDVLREARLSYAGTSLEAEILLLSAKNALALEDSYRARYFLSELRSRVSGGPTAYAAGILLGDLLYSQRLYADALDSYLWAYRSSGAVPLADPGELNLLSFRIAELGALHTARLAEAREHIARVSAGVLPQELRGLYSIVRSRAEWEAFQPPGVKDPNISAIAVDGDDLWIGTWTGGLVRLARSSGEHETFREEESSLVANTVRAICITARHVWVGTDQGLSQYSKALSQWRSVEQFGAPSPRKIQAIHEVDDRVYVATLGDGLWELAQEQWRRIEGRGLPGAHVTCLGHTPQWLLVGTMDAGLAMWNLSSRSFVHIDEVSSGIPARNITFVHQDKHGTVWVGSYGDGLWSWDPAEAAVRHYSSGGGRILDDWVMCVAESPARLYFGTFGGGVATVDAAGEWGSLGLEDGLGSLDVMAAAWHAPAVYFGTLGSGVSVYYEELRR